LPYCPAQSALRGGVTLGGRFTLLEGVLFRDMRRC